jgi:hypothetical protein
VGSWSRLLDDHVCVMCKVLLRIAAVWADCDCCPGWVEPVPSGVSLDGPEPGGVRAMPAAPAVPERRAA